MRLLALIIIIECEIIFVRVRTTWPHDSNGTATTTTTTPGELELASIIVRVYLPHCMCAALKDFSRAYKRIAAALENTFCALALICINNGRRRENAGDDLHHSNSPKRSELILSTRAYLLLFCLGCISRRRRRRPINLVAETSCFSCTRASAHTQSKPSN